MKLLDKNIMSNWAYYQCYNGNDTQDMRNLITSSWYAYLYCTNIEDIEEMWRKITDPELAEWYCKNISNRHEVRKIYKGENN